MEDKKKISVQVMIQTNLLVTISVDEDITDAEAIQKAIIASSTYTKAPSEHYSVTRPLNKQESLNFGKYKPDPELQKRALWDQEREEKNLQKASERTDGISYYRCNALSKLEDLADELAKLPETETRHATSILYRKVREKRKK
jgi:hypothetical protein